MGQTDRQTDGQTDGRPTAAQTLPRILRGQCQQVSKVTRQTVASPTHIHVCTVPMYFITWNNSVITYSNKYAISAETHAGRVGSH